MLTSADIRELLSKVTYLDWKCVLRFRGDGETNPYLQWQFYADDTDNPTDEKTLQKGRKWYLSYYMIEQEVERTAFLALQQAVIHEMCENYKFSGYAIRHPHINPWALHSMMMKGRTHHGEKVIVNRPENNG